MTGFEYKVVPAPTRALKAKGVKGTPARFANALETVMNDMGAQGWEYQRTDTLPVEERQGLTGKTTSFQNMLVFRRVLETTPETNTAVPALIEDQSAQADDLAQTAPEEAAPEADATPEADTSEETVDAETRIDRTLQADGPQSTGRLRARRGSDAADGTQLSAE